MAESIRLNNEMIAKVATLVAEVANLKQDNIDLKAENESLRERVEGVEIKVNHAASVWGGFLLGIGAISAIIGGHADKLKDKLLGLLS